MGSKGSSGRDGITREWRVRDVKWKESDGKVHWGVKSEGCEVKREWWEGSLGSEEWGMWRNMRKWKESDGKVHWGVKSEGCEGTWGSEKWGMGWIVLM